MGAAASSGASSPPRRRHLDSRHAMRPTTKAKANAAAKVAVNVAALEEMRAADVLRCRVRLEERVVAHLRRKWRLRCGLAVEVEAAHVGAVNEHRCAAACKKRAQL